MKQSSNNQHTRISMITGATILKQLKHGNVIGVSKFLCERLRVSFLTTNSPTSSRKKIGRIHWEINQRIKQQSVDSCDVPERKLIIVHCVSCFWRDFVNKRNVTSINVYVFNRNLSYLSLNLTILLEQTLLLFLRYSKVVKKMKSVWYSMFSNNHANSFYKNGKRLRQTMLLIEIHVPWLVK